MRKISLSKALKLWQMTTYHDSEHLTEKAFQRFMAGNRTNDVLMHLALCNMCRKKLYVLQDQALKGSEAADYALPLAASVGVPEEATWTTLDKKYRIKFYKVASQEANQALLIVSVLPPFNFAGKNIVVRDANRRVLLSGKIDDDGELGGLVGDAASLDLKKISLNEE